MEIFPGKISIVEIYMTDTIQSEHYTKDDDEIVKSTSEHLKIVVKRQTDKGRDRKAHNRRRDKFNDVEEHFQVRKMRRAHRLNGSTTNIKIPNPFLHSQTPGELPASDIPKDKQQIHFMLIIIFIVSWYFCPATS